MLRRHPEHPDRLQARPVPRLAEVPTLPAELLERLTEHREAILWLLAVGLEPSTPEGQSFRDSQILAWGAAGLPGCYLRNGGQPWLVIAGELLGGKWPDG